MHTGLVIVGIVVVAAIILYVVDRKSRGEPIDLGILAKISSFSAIVTGGIVFALQSESVTEAVSAVTESAQDMFVGKPSF
jgi:hypothetical protein